MVMENLEKLLRRERMNKHTSDTWAEMLDVLKDIGTHRNENVKPTHTEKCYYCNSCIEDGVVKGGYTYCNIDHAIKNALKKSEESN
jgi:hypothetical protein